MRLRRFCLFAIFCLGTCGLYAQPIPEQSPTFAPLNEPQPVQPPQDQFYAEFAKMMTMLGVIIIVLLLVMWFLKRLLSSRFDQMNAASSIKVIERRAISNRTTLYLIEAGDKRHILAESHNGLASLGVVSGDFEKHQSPFEKLVDEKVQ